MKLKDLLIGMRGDLPGYDDVLAFQKLRLAVREFCQFTEVWRETLPAINLVADTSVYQAISSRSSASIVRITSLKIQDVEQDATDYTFTDGRTITLDDGITPSSAVTGGLVIEVALIPGRAIERMDPDSFVLQWQDGFVAGAMSKLQGMKERQWFDPVAANGNATLFETYKAFARREAQSGNRSVQLKVSARPWK